jgi:hypothetical protein
MHLIFSLKVQFQVAVTQESEAFYLLVLASNIADSGLVGATIS